MALDPEIEVIEIAPLGAPGTGVTPGQWSTIRSDVDGLLTRPAITMLDDVPDVVLTAIADGDIIQWDAAGSRWVNAASGETIATVKRDGTDVLAHAARLNFASTFTAAVNGADGSQVDVGANVGTAAGTLAAGDHVHNIAILNIRTFAATGSLTSGTRTLISFSTDTHANGVIYQAEATLVVTGQNDINAGTVTLGAKIGTQAATTREQRTVGGVPHDMSVISLRAFTGTGTSLTITGTVAYASGDSTDIRDGYLIYRAWPRR